MTNLRETIQGATPEKWTVAKREIPATNSRLGTVFLDIPDIDPKGCGKHIEAIEIHGAERHKNAAFIAAARTALPAALDLIEKCEKFFTNIRGLTYNPTYESTGLEFGIATEALAAIEAFRKEWG